MCPHACPCGIGEAFSLVNKHQLVMHMYTTHHIHNYKPAPMMCKAKSRLRLDLDLSPNFIENGLALDLDLT